MASTKLSDYEKKMIELQYQLKENNMYMEDCFKDLDSWANDMKEKEKKILENPDYIKTQNKGLPPIRTLATTKKKKKIKKEKKDQESQPKTKKLNSYDYRAWDKIDVDKMCQEVDEKKTSSSEYTTDDEWEEEQKRVRADWEKERGNQFFKDNMLNEAINCYTKAIEFDPTKAVYPANRAMCLIKQEKYGVAEIDCSLAIELDPKYTKAYYRRANARVKLKKYEDARKDYEQVLKLEPSNKAAQAELASLESLIDGHQLVFPINKPEGQRSKKPLKTILIEEINSDSVNKIELEKNLEEIKQRTKLDAKDEKLFGHGSSDNHSVEVKPNKIEKLGKEVQSLKLDEKLEIKKLIPDRPQNGYQFKKDWQSLKSNLIDLSVYLKKIPPSDYAKLFQNGLESDNLSIMLKVFRDYFINDSTINVHEHMKSLCQVKRFNTQLMFLTSDDQKNITELLEHLTKSLDANSLAELSNSYKF